jgi:hypothetical protein
MFRKRLPILGGFLVFQATCFFHVATTRGIATFSAANPETFSNLIAFPLDFYSWDSTNITYQFDSSFTDYFSDSRIQDQIRLAFAQWDTANAGQTAPNFSYLRGRVRSPGDISSIAVTRSGVLGPQHPTKPR